MDGYINILFNDKDIKKDLLKISSDLAYPQLFVIINSLENIRRPLYEIEKIKKVLENEAKDDEKAKDMLFEEMKYLENEIISLIDSYLFTSSPDSYWVYNREEIFIKSKTDINKKLSKICEEKLAL